MIPDSTFDAIAPMRRVSNEFMVNLKKEENSRLFQENRRKFKIEGIDRPFSGSGKFSVEKEGYSPIYVKISDSRM